MIDCPLREGMAHHYLYNKHVTPASSPQQQVAQSCSGGVVFIVFSLFWQLPQRQHPQLHDKLEGRDGFQCTDTQAQVCVGRCPGGFWKLGLLKSARCFEVTVQLDFRTCGEKEVEELLESFTATRLSLFHSCVCCELIWATASHTTSCILFLSRE